MWVWISTDNKYYAVPRKDIPTYECDICSIDGKQWWFSKRYVAKGFNDTDKRYLYPEFSHMIGGYSRLRQLKNGHHAFKISFGDYNTELKIIPWTGNTELKSYEAEFKKRVNIKKDILLINGEDK